MKGITYTQVAQYCVLIFAYMVPAIFISIVMTGNPIPQIGFGGHEAGTTSFLLDKLDGLHAELGFAPYTDGSKSTLDVFFITAALMVGTAGLPHVIIRFYTVPRVRDARSSAGWALFFIAILYTTAPAVAVFARHEPLEHGLRPPAGRDAGLVRDLGEHRPDLVRRQERRRARAVRADLATNELVIDKDIMVLANPEIAGLPDWIVGLVAAGALAAALSTAAGLLLVVSSAVSHDLLKRALKPNITERGELIAARVSAAIAVGVAGYLGIHPPDYVAAVVAFAFGLAASSFFPVLFLGIFTKRINRAGAILGMLSGIGFTSTYIVWFKFVDPAASTPENWWFGISPEGIGTIGMLINFVVAIVASLLTAPPPERVRRLVEEIRLPRGAGEAHEISA